MGRGLVMPRWLGRIFYTFRGKRKVRLHVARPDGGSDVTVEGILLGRWAGHYILIVPQLVKGENNSIELDGMLEVPAEKVIFVQVIK